MKLIEISVYFSGVVVVAAESEEKAIAHINNMDVKDILAEIECVEKCDVDTFHIREPKSDDLEDEAHFVVKPAPSEGWEKKECFLIFEDHEPVKLVDSMQKFNKHDSHGKTKTWLSFDLE